MKERILFECIGQAAGNIGQLFTKKGYVCHFINTSNDDLTSLEVRDNFKYHIPGAMGCNKDRKKAMYYAKDYYEHIVNVIDSRFPRQDIIYFIFSLGGGTGSGISPVILDYLSQKNPHKSYGAIVILPANDEPMKTQLNAVEAYKQLIGIENLKSIFVLDNNNGDKFEINERFVSLFDRFVNITNPDSRGIIDQAELELLLTCKGVTIMGDIVVPEMYGYSLDEAIREERLFAPFKKGCQYIAVSMCDNISTEVLEKSFGIPIDMFVGYNEEINFIVCTGLPYYTERINSLATRIKARSFDREVKVKEREIELPVIEHLKEVKKEPTEKLDFDKVFGKFIG